MDLLVEAGHARCATCRATIATDADSPAGWTSLVLTAMETHRCPPEAPPELPPEGQSSQILRAYGFTP